MPDRLKVACVGAGYFAQFHYEAWARMADVELIGVCNRTSAKAHEIAKAHGIANVFDNLAAMLDATGPDVLDIITPPETHASAIALGAERGLAMICQKPFTTDLATARAAANLAATRHVTLVVHENFRFQPWYAAIKQAIDDGAIGEPYQIGFRLRPGDGQGPDAYLARQPYFQTMPRFLVHETAIHFIDVFRYLLGEITGVFARLVKLNPVIAGEDAGYIVFDFANRARGLFDGNRLVDHPADNHRLTMGELLIEGSDGALSLDGDGGVHLRKHGETGWQPVPFAWQARGFAGDCVYRLQRHVVDCLRSGSQPMNTAAAYVRNLEIEEAVYRSSASGQFIALSGDTAA